MQAARPRWLGQLTIAGSAVALTLAPVMVAIKYMTGWAIVPAPFWVPAAEGMLAAAFPAATPAELWMGFGTVYSAGLTLLLAGLVGLAPYLRGRSRAQQAGYWMVVTGLVLVIPGDAIHSWTWHQHGLTVPTPGTNPVANTAYAAHMMGMNFVMAGTLVLGIAALRQRTLARWVAWLFVLVFPAALFASLVLLPTTPSGALWLFAVLMGACGYLVARGRAPRLVAVEA